MLDGSLKRKLMDSVQTSMRMCGEKSRLNFDLRISGDSVATPYAALEDNSTDKE